MSYKPQDPYFHRAKREGYVARSVYKLQEIDQRYQLLRPGMQVIDLGAAPGSWSQYLAQRVGPTGAVLAIDLQPLRYQAPEVTFWQIDVFAAEVEERIAGQAWDGLVSDMAPATTGSRTTDHIRSAQLVARALALAELAVRPGGFWVAKLLEGPQREVLTAQARQLFQEVFLLRPKSTRKGSTECFLIGRKRRS